MAGPFLIVVLAIGVVVGLLQSVTQLQEPTLTFVPKLVGAAIVIAVSGNWMLATLVSFGHELMASVPASVERLSAMQFFIEPSALVGFCLVLVRAGAWVTICPPFNMPAIPVRVRAGVRGRDVVACWPAGWAPRSQSISTASLVGAMFTPAAGRVRARACSSSSSSRQSSRPVS